MAAAASAAAAAQRQQRGSESSGGESWRREMAALSGETAVKAKSIAWRLAASAACGDAA
jgi:hypothetical protein